MVINKHLLMVYWAYYVAIRKVVFSLHAINMSLPSGIYNHLRPARGSIHWLPDPMIYTTFEIMYILALFHYIFLLFSHVTELSCMRN